MSIVAAISSDRSGSDSCDVLLSCCLLGRSLGLELGLCFAGLLLEPLAFLLEPDSLVLSREEGGLLLHTLLLCDERLLS